MIQPIRAQRRRHRQPADMLQAGGGADVEWRLEGKAGLGD